MPTIVNGWLAMLMTSPIGMISRPVCSGDPNNSSRMAVPITHTGLARSSSSSVKKRPCWSVCRFISSTAGQTPTASDGTTVLSPLVTATSPTRISGETTRRRGALSRNASTSFMVRPGAWSARCSCSGGTSSSSSNTLSAPPMAIIVSFIPFSMPLMMAAMPTRLATPRMIPSIVSRERNLWDHTSFRPTMMVLKKFTPTRNAEPGSGSSARL